MHVKSINNKYDCDIIYLQISCTSFGNIFNIFSNIIYITINNGAATTDPPLHMDMMIII